MKGKLLGGRYRVVEILASGGFGQTYVAQDTHRPGNPNCVVKHLKPAHTNSRFLQSARRLFQTEAETLEKLGSHDQIPRLLAFFEENQEFYLVQDFIQGHPLTVELQPGECWLESQVCQLLEEVLGILEFVHGQGVIHRDIKPDNLIRRQQDNKLVLVDFGTVKQLRNQLLLNAPGQVNITIVVGTPGYMPTEQGQGKPRQNSDIYALGIICIQALTGLHPTQFQEDQNTGEILWRDQAPQVSDALASVLTKMVRYHFKDRYQTAETAAEVLQSIQLITTGYKNGSRRAEGEKTTYKNLYLYSSSTPEASEGTSPAPCSLLPAPSDLAHFEPSPLPTEINAEVKEDSALSENVKSNAAVDLPEAQVMPDFPVVLPTHKGHHLRIWAGISAVLIGVVAGYAVHWQSLKSVSTTLDKIEALTAEEKYAECVLQASKIPQDSSFYTDSQILLRECQLAQAMRFAATGNFQAAISEAAKVPQNSAYRQDAEQMIAQWSASLLEATEKQYQLGKLDKAIALAKAIPEMSPLHQKSQELIQQWSRDWEQNNSYLKAARTALNQGKWEQAINAAKQVRATLYWQQQSAPIIRKAESKLADSIVAVTRRPTRAVKRVATRTARRTTYTRVRRPAPAIAARSTPRRAARAVNRRVRRPVTRRIIRKTPQKLPLSTLKRTTRSLPPQPPYTWTTETVP